MDDCAVTQRVQERPAAVALARSSQCQLVTPPVARHALCGLQTAKLLPKGSKALLWTRPKRVIHVSNVLKSHVFHGCHRSASCKNPEP